MNTKTQELVTAGYALAKGLDAGSAKLVKELATELAVQRVRADELNKQVVNLAVENASLLPKAASELSNAWMLHKYWVGIQVALMHVNAGRLHDGMTWLQNTVSGPGIEAPQLSDFAEIEAWANEQQKDSIGHVRALEIIKAALPATDAAIANIQAQAIPTGWQLIPEELHISEEDIELICSQCGNGDELYGEFVDGIFRVGEVETDDGKKVYGLHISCADYQGEGSVTIATFDNPLRKEAGNAN